MSYIGNGLENSTINYINEYTATQGQTTFYAVYDTHVDVYVNGLKLDSTAYTATDGMSVVLVSGLTAGDIVYVNGYTDIGKVNSYTIAESDAALALKANLASPTFTGTPTAPTPTAGDNSTNIATTAFVKAKSELDSIGIGQTWTDVSGSRSGGVTYTNTTGKPIMVSVTIGGSTSTSDAVFTMTIDSSVRKASRSFSDGVSKGQTCITAIIPNGSTYSITITTGVIDYWQELR